MNFRHIIIKHHYTRNRKDRNEINIWLKGWSITENIVRENKSISHLPYFPTIPAFFVLLVCEKTNTISYKHTTLGNTKSICNKIHPRHFQKLNSQILRNENHNPKLRFFFIFPNSELVQDNNKLLRFGSTKTKPTLQSIFPRKLKQQTNFCEYKQSISREREREVPLLWVRGSLAVKGWSGWYWLLRAVEENPNLVCSNL